MTNTEKARKLAELIHYKTCHINHTDQCDWFYGSWENPLSTHNRYLKIAQKILSKVTYEDAILVIGCL